MRTLSFSVKQQRLIKTSNFAHIVAGSKGYLRCSFDFSDDWDGCIKVASFYDLDDCEYAVPIVNSVCDVPDDVTDGLFIRVRVLGKRGDGFTIQTKTATIRQEVG